MNRKAKIAVAGGVVMLIVITLGVGCQQNSALSETPSQSGMIALASRPAPERPIVQFPHDLHSTLEDGAESCAVCHSRLSVLDMDFSYVKDDDGMSRNAIRDRWHDMCVGCHQDYVKKGQTENRPGGPLTCGGCHVRNMSDLSAPGKLAFYDEYHELHEYLDGDCGLCHHAYDERTEQLYYEPGVEEACWRCHEKSRQGAVPSLKEASHISCVGCHLVRVGQGEDHLPIDCAGCHPPAE